MTKKVELHTSHGLIVAELDDVKAPLSTANFIAYVEKGHFDGTIFHRVIKGFMVQGGGFDADMKQKDCDARSLLQASDPTYQDATARLVRRSQSLASPPRWLWRVEIPSPEFAAATFPKLQPSPSAANAVE